VLPINYLGVSYTTTYIANARSGGCGHTFQRRSDEPELLDDECAGPDGIEEVPLVGLAIVQLTCAGLRLSPLSFL
jgi:hypothetical protein